LTETLRWKLTEDAMVMSAAKAHWKPMKLADEGKWSTAERVAQHSHVQARQADLVRTSTSPASASYLI
jgi:hypothetical protein